MLVLRGAVVVGLVVVGSVVVVALVFGVVAPLEVLLSVVVVPFWALLDSGLGGLLARRAILDFNQPRTPDFVGEVGVPAETEVVRVEVSREVDGVVVIGGAVLTGLLVVAGLGSSTALVVAGSSAVVAVVGAVAAVETV